MTMAGTPPSAVVSAMEEVMHRSLFLAAFVATVSFLSWGCGSSSEPTNAEILKNYKPEPTNNPGKPVVDGANKEFGSKGKPTQ